ncbi:MAG TPA: helix-turn-helix domain-containing protein [Patescibacteria group bacterium]|nr:helix-turn-helix domain-containing protein [Patescibacteria group bacterium]
MTEEKLLTIRDVSIALGVSEKEVMDLAEAGQLPAYKIGGMYLRFKAHQIEEYKRKMRAAASYQPTQETYSLGERIRDFFYFNDFYILSALLIMIMLVVILRGY